MTNGKPEPIIPESHVLETYRYLRIGLIGAAALLGASVLIERFQVDCWQWSISAYYYTPARGVFIGTLVAVGLVLIVIKGRGFEDLYLNLAGMFAPVVAFVPTRSFADCYSVEPISNPDVIANIENNMWALIIAGALGLALAVFFYVRKRESFLWPFEVGDGDRATLLGMALVGGIIGISAVLLWVWDDFAFRAHDVAAIAMFICLALASVWNARRAETSAYRRTYWIVAVLMAASLGIIWLLTLIIDDWRHSILWLEIVEISLFAAYWIAQTAEHWGERVVTSPDATT